MKRFIIKAAIFMMIILTPIFTFNALYKNTNFYLAMNELYYLKVHPDNITFCNLGNSHEMCGLKYKDIYRGVAHNFATSSQPFYYNYQVLKHVSGSIAPNAIVVIPISYFDWYYNYEELFIEDTNSFNKRYYSLLPASSMYNYNFDDDVKYNHLSVLTAKENLKFIFSDFDLSYFDRHDDTRVADNFIQSAKTRFETWTEHVMAKEEKRDRAKQSNIEYFKKTIDLCIEMGYTPVVVCSPVTGELSNLFSGGLLEDFDTINSEVLSEYEDIIFLDYSRDHRISARHEFFRDASHLNTAGAKAYTQCLLWDLVELGVLDADRVSVS